MTSRLKYSLLIKALSFFKVPLLFATSPKIVSLSETESTIYIPLKRKNKNHLGSMYFGALAMGAELSIALTAIKEIHERKEKIDFIFKDFKANFLKRAQGGTYFVCEDPKGVKELVEKSSLNFERHEKIFHGYAYVQDPNAPVLSYSLTLSVKQRK